MRKIVTVILLLSSAALVIGQTAIQGEGWRLNAYPYAEDIQDLVNQEIQDGYVPAGLHVVPGESIMVLFHESDQEIDQWALVAIDSLDRVNAEVSGFLQEGWLPVDFSMTGEDMHVLFLKTDYEFKSWRIVTATSDSDEALLSIIGDVTKTQFDEDRILFGVNALGNQVHLLFVESDTLLANSQMAVQVYPNDGEAFYNALNEHLAAGAVPGGFALSQDRVVIPFFR